MKKKLSLTLIIIISICISCTGNDVRELTFDNFKPTMMKKAKSAFMPLIFYNENNDILYLKNFMTAYEEFLKGWKLIFPHQTYALLDTSSVLSKFNEVSKFEVSQRIQAWVEIGEKIQAQYIIICILQKPNHVTIKKTKREIEYRTERNSTTQIPVTVTSFIDVNIWYLKGDVYIIDVKEKKMVYSFFAESKAGYRRGSTRGFGITSFTEAIESLSEESEPSLKKAVYFFFKTLFKKWN
mgnify:CR=1 FL=1